MSFRPMRHLLGTSLSLALASTAPHSTARSPGRRSRLITADVRRPVLRVLLDDVLRLLHLIDEARHIELVRFGDFFPGLAAPKLVDDLIERQTAGSGEAVRDQQLAPV